MRCDRLRGADRVRARLETMAAEHRCAARGGGRAARSARPAPGTALARRRGRAHARGGGLRRAAPSVDAPADRHIARRGVRAASRERPARLRPRRLGRRAEDHGRLDARGPLAGVPVQPRRPAGRAEALAPLPAREGIAPLVRHQGRLDAPVTLDELKGSDVDTVLLAIVDMQGRLQGKRLTKEHFLDEVVPNAAEGCNYLLAVDVDMKTVEGYSMSSWEKGYGDFVMAPDLDTLCPIPWHPATALVMADVKWDDGSDVVASPRQILKRQLDRLSERGWIANAGTELEFILFRDTYEQAWHKGYRDLEPANLYNVDYSLLGTARVEPLIRRIRNEMAAAGLTVENSRGECNLGQHEINFRYADALRSADAHALYKNGAKEIAAQEGMAITFMAKFNELEGNSCHIHLSLAGENGSALFDEQPELFDAFVAGQLAALRELTLFFAPNVNSYKRFQPGSFAPTAVAWGRD